MKTRLLAIAIVLVSVSHAQFYYNDIVSTRELNRKMQAFVAARVKSVSAKGFDEKGKESADFNEWQEVQDDGRLLKVTSRTGQTVTRQYYQFDAKTRVINSRDSSGGIQTITTYQYDPDDKLVNVKTTTKDPDHEFDETNERQWFYNPSSQPVRMQRIVNGTDSTEYRFTPDEKGNVGDEMLYHRGGAQSPVYYFFEKNKFYYYYDDQHRLTDVTRYNERAKKILPDIMFEYDDRDNVIQRTTVVSTTSVPDYFIWRYLIDEKGLKTREALFNKYKELKGKVEYTYTFQP